MYRIVCIQPSYTAVQSIPDDKFLLFDAHLGGQGTGNIISGLLAAHLFGIEFNRTVCILPYYDAFLSVFDAVNEDSVTKCETLFQGKLPSTVGIHIRLVNFESAPDECELQDQLKSDEKILYITGNTYPRWPQVPDNFFFSHYKAKQVLLDALPYDPKTPPTTVVHLRSPDSPKGDFRKGLDSDSLTALGDLLPTGTNTYLVTNRVAYYEQFEACCQWSHPVWNTVIHSAKHRQWGSLHKDTADRGLTRQQQKLEENQQQNLQMWADWYTVLKAPTVYHTHSDFSISAIHWTNNKDSHSIAGYDGGVLQTTKESWWIEGETAPLVQRSRTALDTSKLRLCRANTAQLRRRNKNFDTYLDQQQLVKLNRDKKG